MNLSRKIILVIISTFIALIFIVAGTSDVILLNSYRLLEKKQVLDNIQQVYNQIEDRIEQIDVTARDFSLELTERLQHDSRVTSIDQRYFSETSLRIHRIDLAALYNTRGRLITVRSIDCETGGYCPVEPGKLRALDAFVSSILESTRIKLSGTIDIDGEPFMVSVKPLMGINGTRLGTLVVGCFLDKMELEHIYKVTGASARVVGLSSHELTDEESLAHNELKVNDGMLSRVNGTASVSGYAYLKDMFGQPTHLVSISKKRTLMDQGKSNIFYILLVLFICGAIFCCVMLMFIRGAVLKRLANLSITVGEISRHGDISERLEIKGEDELEDLAGSINSMLASLESAEFSLKESEERYRALFERAPDSIFIIGTEGSESGRIMNANRAACEQHGYSSEEICTMHIQDLNTPESNYISQKLMKRIMHGEWVTQEVWHNKKDGSKFPIEIHAGLIKLGSCNYILGFDRDITSRKLAEESDRMYLDQIRQLNTELGCKAAELAVVNKELESFNYSVSHDMRGPLTRVSGYCQLMLDDEIGTDPQIRTYLSRIYESCCWLDEMIDAMLTLSRLARADFVPDEVNLSTIVEGVVRDLTQAEPERAVEAVIAPDVKVIGDAPLLKILVSNLINNAWKYSARKERTCIEFGVMCNGSIPVYFVCDNGAGFDMKDIDKLFRVFTRLHDPTQFSGSGIGLATVQRVIARHGGRVWAEGEVGRGATFFFTLVPDAPAVNS
jgi:PAS domain S-box-containing protein